MFIERQRLANRLGQRPRRKFPKFDAVGERRAFREINNAVVQAACGADDGNGSVAQAIHIWFKPLGSNSDGIK